MCAANIILVIRRGKNKGPQHCKFYCKSLFARSATVNWPFMHLSALCSWMVQSHVLLFGAFRGRGVVWLQLFWLWLTWSVWLVMIRCTSSPTLCLWHTCCCRPRTQVTENWNGFRNRAQSKLKSSLQVETIPDWNHICFHFRVWILNYKGSLPNTFIAFLFCPSFFFVMLLFFFFTCFFPFLPVCQKFEFQWGWLRGTSI